MSITVLYPLNKGEGPNLSALTEINRIVENLLSALAAGSTSEEMLSDVGLQGYRTYKFTAEEVQIIGQQCKEVISNGQLTKDRIVNALNPSHADKELYMITQMITRIGIWSMQC